MANSKGASAPAPNPRICNDRLWVDGKVSAHRLGELLRNAPGNFDDAFLGDLLTMADELSASGVSPDEVCACVRKAVDRASESHVRAAKKAAAKASLRASAEATPPNVRVLVRRSRSKAD